MTYIPTYICTYVLNNQIAEWRIARALWVVGGNVGNFGNLVVVDAVKKSIRRKYLYLV